jgi:hypothetical protein
MIPVRHEALWKVAFLVLVLVFFVCVGVAHILSPDRFISGTNHPIHIDGNSLAGESDRRKLTDYLEFG